MGIKLNIKEKNRGNINVNFHKLRSNFFLLERFIFANLNFLFVSKLCSVRQKFVQIWGIVQKNLPLCDFFLNLVDREGKHF